MRNKLSKSLIYTCQTCGKKGKCNEMLYQQEVTYLVDKVICSGQRLIDMRKITVYCCSEKCKDETVKKMLKLSLQERACWLSEMS